MRVARYLSIVNDIITKDEHALRRLHGLSEEYKRSLQLRTKV